MKRGLSAIEARTRLERVGRNELTAEEAVPGRKKFLAQSKDALVILLLIATADGRIRPMRSSDAMRKPMCRAVWRR